MVKSMTQGNPAKMIILFAIPLIFGNLFQQIYNMADTFIVGQTIGVNAVAAVGSTGSLIFFIIGFAFGFTSGLAILLSQRFGANDFEGVRVSFAAGIMLSGLVIVVLTIVSVIFARPALELMNTPDEIIDDSYSYLIVMLWGLAGIMAFNLLSNVIRALGDSRTPLFFLGIVCVLNIILDYVLIVHVHMGVNGAAVATVISQFVSMVLCVIYIKRRLPILHLKREHFQAAPREFAAHIKVAIPMGFQASIIAIGAIILQIALNTLGTTSVAAYSAASKIDSLGVMPLNSFGATMATYTAQNYGAKQYDRIKSGVRQCIAMSIGVSIFIAIINITLGRHLVGIFVGAEATEVIGLGRTYLIINGVMYWILALLFIYRFALQGLGHSFIPTVAGVMELVMRAFAAIVLASSIGFAGAAMANPLAWIGAAIPLTIAYQRSIRKLPPTAPTVSS